MSKHVLKVEPNKKNPDMAYFHFSFDLDVWKGMHELSRRGERLQKLLEALPCLRNSDTFSSVFFYDEDCIEVLKRHALAWKDVITLVAQVIKEAYQIEDLEIVSNLK